MKTLYTPIIMNKILLICVSMCLSLTVMADDAQLSVTERNTQQGFNDTIDRLAPDFVLVSLCVADPTDQSQDYLGITGHAFLRLQCPTFGLDYCFSYESEKIKGQLWDYLTGKLKMGMFAVPTDEYIEDYRIWKRAVHEYRINMPPEAEQRLWEQMDNHMLSEQEMQMDLFKFGCTNTVLRYVEKALSPDEIEYQWPEKYSTLSAIEITEQHLKNYPWTLLGVRILEGNQLRQLNSPKQKVMFPTDLVEVWSNATIKGEPVLSYAGELVVAEPVDMKKPWFTPQVCGILLFLIVAGSIVFAVIRKRKNHQ